MAHQSLRALWPAVGADFTVFGAVFPILPLFARHLGLSIPAIGGLLALYSVAQLLAAPAWGRLSDRLGRRPVLLVALAGTFASTLLIAVSTTGALLFVAVIFNGASGGSIAVAQAAISDVTPEKERPRAMGTLGAFIAGGFVLGPALSSATSLASFRLPFIVAAGIAGINAIYCFLRFPETLPSARSLIETAGDRPSEVSESATAVPDRRVALRHVVLAFGFSTAAFGALEATFALVGRRHFGFGEAGTGLLFAFLGVVMTIVQARGVRLFGAKLGARWTVNVGSVCFALGLIDIGVTRNLAVLCLGVLLVGLGYGLVSPVLTAAVTNAARSSRRGAVLGRQQAVSSCARIVGPAVGGLLFAAGGAFWTYLVAASCLAVTLFLVADRSSVALLRSFSSRAKNVVVG